MTEIEYLSPQQGPLVRIPLAQYRQYRDALEFKIREQTAINVIAAVEAVLVDHPEWRASDES
jgi:hypothetical protein